MDYSLVDLINKIGLQNIHVQQLSNTFCNLKRRRDNIGEFTFITEQDHLPDLNIAGPNQITFKYEGIVMWVPMDKMHEAVNHFQNAPNQVLDSIKHQYAYHLRFESGWSKNKTAIVSSLTPEVIKKFLMSTEPFEKNFESYDYIDDGLRFQDYLDKIVNDICTSCEDEQEIKITDGDCCPHYCYITKSELI